ncbi:MAG: acyl carrier protein phosphodiesterase [Crocinitomicaceae bacterium]|nr:acyl carrier protein phosphodiesterase [Crocinitomicaceae bacterium]
MNFLGHLYFSQDHQELMHANLFGDFVKGKHYEKYSDLVQKGVLLHRSIDHFIDTNEQVVKLMRTLYTDLPKISSVAIDLYFDHLLARYWDKFHQMSLTTYLTNFYNHQPYNWEEYPEVFQHFLVKMKSYKWMSYYHSHEGLTKACHGVSSRISFENQLKNAPSIFLSREQEITSVFFQYMEAAQNALLDHSANNSFVRLFNK